MTTKTFGPRQRDNQRRDAVQVMLWGKRLEEIMDWRSRVSYEEDPIDAEIVRRLAQVIADVAQRMADVKPSKTVPPVEAPYSTEWNPEPGISREDYVRQGASALEMTQLGHAWDRGEA